MNKLKFVVLAHLYLIRLLWNHGIAGANVFFDRELKTREKFMLFANAYGACPKRAKRINRKYCIIRLKEASLKK